MMMMPETIELAWLVQLTLVALLSALIYFNFYLWCLPMNRTRTFEDHVGFAHIKGCNNKVRRDNINRLRKLRKPGNTPPPFPNGWYIILESRNLSRGQILPVSAWNLNLAVYRGKDSGQVFISDTYCPHLGADLTAGGKLHGDCISCPFHNWQFSSQTGACVSVPGPSKKVTPPVTARLKMYHCQEANGYIYFWHHSQGSGPEWQVPIIKDLGGWVYQGRNEYHVACHIQDIPENGADVAHLPAVHSSTIFGGGEPSEFLEWLTQWTWHEWNIGWQPDVEQKHVARVQLKHSMTMFGKLDVFSLDVRAEQIGPAMVHLHFESILGKGVMIQYTVPVEPLMQKVVHEFYTERSWIPPYAKMVLWGESVLFERDVRVWNSKTYADKPLLSSEDRLIKLHRRWYQQFYDDHHIKTVKEAKMEW